jgi:amidohydrolase
MDPSRLIRQVADEVIQLRREFHQHPELGNREFRTSKRVTQYLEALGVACRTVNQTGVVGVLEGGRPGPTLLLRADLDALPITEETGVDYCSRTPGVMHACGHDAHTAMLLAAAKVLVQVKDQLAGRVKFAFQPNEEEVGALAMIEAGLLEDPKVDAALGLHVWAPLATGSIGIADGAVMAGMDHFELIVRGKGGHTASPQSAVDPVLCAADLIQSVQMIQTRQIDALTEPTIIMFGQIQGGTASNIIPDRVRLSGTLRYLFAGDPDGPDSPRRKFERIAAGVTATHGAEYDLDFVFGHPALVNHPGMADLVRDVAAHQLDPPPPVGSPVTLAGEDFSEIAARTPSAFYFLGVGNPDKGCDFPHHHPCFNLDEDALILGVELHVKTTLAFFQRAGSLDFLAR